MMKNYVEIESQEALRAVVERHHTLRHYAFQRVDFSAESLSEECEFEDCIFIGCVVPLSMQERLSPTC